MIVFKFLKILFFTLGLSFALMICLAFTDIPFIAYERLGIVESNFSENPEVIILLGGEGMPSADGLMRCYTASEKALFFNQTSVIIALPSDSSKKDPERIIHMMAHELVLRGVDTNRISFETKGTNTYYQAENLKDIVSNDKRLLIVTTPEHMYRAVSVFKKIGFSHVGSAPAFENDLSIQSLNPKKRSFQPNLAFRYNLWSYLKYEISVAREYVAIAYYKIRGWI